MKTREQYGTAYSLEEAEGVASHIPMDIYPREIMQWLIAQCKQQKGILERMVASCRCGGTGKLEVVDWDSEQPEHPDSGFAPLPGVKIADCRLCREARDFLKGIL